MTRETCRKPGCLAEPAPYNPERPGDNGFCDDHAAANEQRRRQQTASNQLSDRRFFSKARLR